MKGATLLAEALLCAAHNDAWVARVRLAHLVALVVVPEVAQVGGAAVHLQKHHRTIKRAQPVQRRGQSEEIAATMLTGTCHAQLVGDESASAGPGFVSKEA